MTHIEKYIVYVENIIRLYRTSKARINKSLLREQIVQVLECMLLQWNSHHQYVCTQFEEKTNWGFSRLYVCLSLSYVHICKKISIYACIGSQGETYTEIYRDFILQFGSCSYKGELSIIFGSSLKQINYNQEKRASQEPLTDNQSLCCLFRS